MICPKPHGILSQEEEEEQFLTTRKQQSGFLTAITTSGNFTLEKARKALQAVQAQYNHEAITEAASQLPDVAVEIGKGKNGIY